MMIPFQTIDGGGGGSPLMGTPNPLSYMELWQIAVLSAMAGLLILWVLAHVLLNRWRQRHHAHTVPARGSAARGEDHPSAD